MPQTPIDTLQRLAALHHWEHHRHGHNLLAEIRGAWSRYTLHGCWDSRENVLHLLCSINAEIPQEKIPSIYRLIGKINETLWLGNFIYSSNTKRVHFRLSLLANDNDEFVRRLQEMLAFLQRECDRCYPGIQQVAWTNLDVDSAVQMLNEPEQGHA